MFVQWQWQCISQRGLMLHLQSNYRVVVVVVVFGYAPDQTILSMQCPSIRTEIVLRVCH